MERSVFGSAIEGFDLNANIFRSSLRVLDEDVEVSVLIEDTSVQQLVFEPVSRSSLVLFDQITVRKLGLRILVEILHVAVRRRIVEIEVILFDVFTVIALRRNQPERSFLKNGIALVPKTKSKHEQLVAVANSCEAVFSPSISAASSLTVGKKLPGVSV